jgi:hypothetical protein
VCATTPSVQLKPYQSEYEGHMGNYGNTMDRWYRRAAVVVWPRERAFAARAQASSSWALDELHARVEAGDLSGARAAAESLAPFWTRIAQQAESLGTALRVAVSLDAHATAAMLLGPFRVETLAPEHAGALAALPARYGLAWTRDLVTRWFGQQRDYYGATDRHGWVEALPELCSALADAGEPGITAAQLLLAGSWHWLDDQLRLWAGHATSAYREPQLELLSRPLVRLLEATVAVSETRLRDQIIASIGQREDTILTCLIPALRSATASPREKRQACGLDTVARDCARRLAAIAARPVRVEDDWSISCPGGCGCGLCGTLREFLTSLSRRSFDWPLAKEGRRHIHTRIDSAELPVRHVTIRSGRPYTLVLTKTDELFEREQRARDRAVADIAWLSENWQTD